MMRVTVLTAILALGCCGGAQAQMDKPAAKAGAVESPAKAADDMLGLVEGQVKGAARAMPADKYEFSPASLNIPGAKYDGVRSFAAQVKHIAQANYFFGMTMSGMKPDVNMKAIGDLKTKDEILVALDASFAFLHKANSTLTAANAMETLPFEGITATKAGVAAFSVAHSFDHYGQIVEYLRMNGIVPPASAN